MNSFRSSFFNLAWKTVQFDLQNVSSNILSCGVRLLKNRAVVISGFQHEVAENCTLLGCYAASSGNLLPVFQDNI
jgi:hypothetical protein